MSFYIYSTNLPTVNLIGSAIDNRIVKFNGTAGNIQTSGITIDADNNVNGIQYLLVRTLFTDDVFYINQLSDFPTPIADVITLVSNKIYIVTTAIDLLGNRINCDGVTVLTGLSSEISSLTTNNASALITANNTLDMRDITYTNTGGPLLNLVNTSVDPVGGALDWRAVNLHGEIGIIQDYRNVVIDSSAWFDCYNCQILGTINTVAFFSCLFIGDGTNTIFTIPAETTINRRFRIIYSSFIQTGTAICIDFNVNSSIPVESYILDTVNFSGGSSNYLSGFTDVNNQTLFIRNVGISNTAVNGQMYMTDNVTATTINNTTDFFRINGTTIASDDNSKYTMTEQRLTNEAVIERSFLIQCTLSFSSGNNNVCIFGFYDSKLGAVRPPSLAATTANSSGRAENVNIMCVVRHSAGDYIEVHVRNSTSTTAVTVSSMNVVITQL